MKELIILVGNIGSGKSTLCKNLQKLGYIIISKDDIRYSIGAGNYIFNLKYEATIDYVSKELFHDFLTMKVPIVIDETNMDKETRYPYIEYASRYNYKKVAVVMPNFSKEESVSRRLSSNHGNTSKSIWEEVWERKNKIYEEPSKNEGFDEIIILEK